jgi:AmiR/NasT family two-component response regulator
MHGIVRRVRIFSPMRADELRPHGVIMTSELPGDPAMSESYLREQLQRLAAELETLPVDAERRRSIEMLIADIEAQLDDGTADDSLVTQVDMAVSTFEAEYPRIAAILNNIVVTLGNIGV